LIAVGLNRLSGDALSPSIPLQQVEKDKIAAKMVTTGLAAFSKYAAPHIVEWLLHLISSLVSLAVIALLFPMMFKWLPDAAVDWNRVWNLHTVLPLPSSSCSSGSITRRKSS
jgi:hypothetical protein